MLEKPRRHSRAAVAAIALLISQPVLPETVSSTGTSNDGCLPAWLPKSVSASGSFDNMTSIAFGPDDFLYAGSSNGFQRLEGGRWRSWFPDDTEPDTLPAGRVNSIYPEGDRLWVGTAAGLSRFEPTSGRFEQVSFTSAAVSPAVQALYEHDGELLVGTLRRGAYTVSLGSNATARRIEFEGSDANLSVNRFYEYDNRLLIATDSGLFVEGDENRFESVDLAAGGGEQPRVADLVSDIDGALLLAATTGLLRLSSLDATAETLYEQGIVDTIAIDRRGTVWFGGRSGLFRLRPGAEEVETCRKWSLTEPNVSVAVSAVMVTEDDWLVMATRGRGTQLAPLATGVSRIPNGEPDFNTLPEKTNLDSYMDSSGRLVLGTATGVYREEQPGARSFEKLERPSLRIGGAWEVHEEDDGTIWIASSTGLYRLFDGLLEHVPTFVGSDGEPLTTRHLDIASYDGHLLVGAQPGLIVLDPATGLPERVFSNNPHVRTVNSAPVTTVSMGQAWHLHVVDDFVYATHSNGVLRLDVDTGTVISNSYEAIEEGRMRPDWHGAAVGTEDGGVYIATGTGVIFTDHTLDAADYVTSLNGFRIGQVPDAERGPDGTLWFPTSTLGLLGYHPERDEWRLLSYENGLHSSMLSFGSVGINDAGTITTAGGGGASVIPFAALQEKRSRSLKLVALNADSGSSIPVDRALTIGPKLRSIAIDFAIPEFIETSRHAIEYTFSSPRQSNSEVIGLGETLTLQQLAPGTYQLTAKVVDPIGARSQQLDFELTVMPFWWETNLAYFLATLAVVLMILFGVYRRSVAVQQRFKLVADERERIAQELHDSFLQEVLGANLMQRSLAKKLPDPELESQAREIIDLLAHAAGAARTSIKSLSDLNELPPLSDAIGSMDPPSRQLDPVPISFDESGEPWPVNQQRRFFLIRIAQEAVNNACKHARANKIHVSLNWTRRAVEIDIKDDGQGFDRNDVEVREGFGLRAMQRMARSGRIRLDITSKSGSGTHVRLAARRRWL